MNQNNYSVWKYTLEVKGSQTIALPLGAEVISVDTQEQDIVVYALVNTKEDQKQDVEVLVYGTGHEINLNITDYKFLGTAKLNNGLLMFHVFYKRV